jgi:hypothetical protein
MIKSKIDARERALELAVETFKGSNRFSSKDVIEVSKEYTNFLIGDAELPETQSDTELVKAFLEVMNSEFEKKCKPNTPDYEELLKAIQTGNAGISADTPCKSEAE